jgi:NAD(P)H-hydrate epimerase
MLRLTREQVRQVDRLATEKYHVPGVVLMENAALAVVEIADEMLDGQCVGEILILCGGGNNGGDGLAVGRHLHNRGADVRLLVLGDPEKYKGEARTNWLIARAMGIDHEPISIAAVERERPLLIIDALFGTGLTTPPREPFAQIVDAVKRSRVQVLAVDVPSGLDCDTGKPLGDACIRANQTVTFVAEKVGFAHPSAMPYIGHITVGDIGCPRACIDEVLRNQAAEATISPP